MTVRVRIAPAPSGSLHIGNARTALYNWLFARHLGGRFVLRIEDTDQTRVRPEFVEMVIEEMRWLGLDYDEGPDIGGPYAPYKQSERLETYRAAADALSEQGLAYRCYCTPEELKERRERAIAEHRKPGYDGRCYRLSESERAAYEQEERRWVLRFHVDDDGSTSFDDLITGNVSVNHSEIEDFPILRQNGFPLYVLGAAIDDAEMEITHVIRGTDLQSSTPRQIMLLRALGRQPPEYAHIPLVFGTDGKPLSKRFGGSSVAWYRENGFLPDALVNGLVLLGTGFGDETILTRQEMIERFALEKVHASPAVLNAERLDWMNGEHIRSLTDDDLANALAPWLARDGLLSEPPSEEEIRLLGQVAPLVKTRVERLDQASALVRGIFKDVEMDPSAVEKVLRAPEVSGFLTRAHEVLSALEPWDAAAVEAALRDVADEMGLKPRKAFMPLYVAISGSTVSAPIFDSMAIIGRDACLHRLARAAQAVSGDPT